MDLTRRSLCGIGAAAVPLAVFAPAIPPGVQEALTPRDALLAYLVDDTKRNCRLLKRPGRARARALRGLGATLEVLVAYLHARHPMSQINPAIRGRVEERGLHAVANRLQEAWPGRAALVAREYGITLPDAPDYQLVTTAIERLQRYGCPRFGGIRGRLDLEAERLDRWEGRAGVAVPVRQTPGSDFGPPGWAAGLGDPTIEISCGDIAMMMAAMVALEEFAPELSSVFGPILAITGVAYALFCSLL